MFWIGVGATVAVVVVVKGRRLLHRFTPEGVVAEVEEQVAGLADRVGEAIVTFRAAVATREHELTESLLGHADVEEARRVRKERRARDVWDFEDSPVDEDDEPTLGYSFF